MGKHKNHQHNNFSMKNIKIQTSLGEAELSPDTYVQVYIDGKNSICKKASALDEGDRVLFNRKKINKTLKDLLPLLERNPVYKYAREQIYDFYNSNEDNGTLLRRLTLEGLILHGYLDDSAEIRKKIKQGKKAELSKDERYMAINGIQEILSKNPENKEKPKEGAFDNWISGKSVLTWGKYIPLLSQINEKLSDFSDTEGKRYNAYKFWEICNQQVIKQLHRGDTADNNKNNKGAKNEDKKRDHHIVVDEIISQVVEEYDSDSVIAPIISAQEINPSENRFYSPVIARGRDNPIDFSTANRDRQILHHYLKFVCAKYLNKSKNLSKENIDQIDEFAPMVISGNISTDHLDNEKKEAAEKLGKKAELFFQDTIDGKIDEIFAVKEGTITRLLKTARNLSYSLPLELVNEFHILKNEVEKLKEDIQVYEKDPQALESAKMQIKMHLEYAGESDEELDYQLKQIIKKQVFQKRIKIGNLEKDLRSVERELEKGYMVKRGDLDKDFYLVQQLVFFKHAEPDSLVPEMPFYFEDVTKDKIEEIKKYIATKPRRGIRQSIEFIRKPEIIDCLKKYGLEALTNLNPYNFILDEDFNTLKKPDYSKHKPHNKNPKWIQEAGKGHDEFVDRLIDNPDLIEPGLQLLDSEYKFGKGWARADLLYQDSQGNLLILEVKQYAKRNGDKFNNAFKAIEQTTAYRAAKQAGIDYCPLLRDMNLKVRGMLVAYEIDDDAKKSLEKQGCEHKEIKYKKSNGEGK